MLEPREIQGTRQLLRHSTHDKARGSFLEKEALRQIRDSGFYRRTKTRQSVLKEKYKAFLAGTSWVKKMVGKTLTAKDQRLKKIKRLRIGRFRVAALFHEFPQESEDHQ